MKTKAKATAIGSLIISMLDLCEKRGGKQKLQKIVGKAIFYESDFKGKYMINNRAISRLSITQLNKLTERVKKT
jgi:hypothetical protein